MKRSRAALVTAVAAAALVLSGCAGAQDAIDQAQGAVDSAQQLVEGAANAPEAIGEACRTALDGLVPGTPVDQAEAALTDATAQIDEALGVAGALPIVSDLRDALVGAAETLLVDAGGNGLTSARDTIESVCSLAPGS